MKKLLFCVLFVPFQIDAQVLIITHNYNRPDFVELQYKTFKKFLKDDYEYVVFNDAKDLNKMHEIDAMCARYNIRCIRVPQEIHTRPYLPRNSGDNLQEANIRHANCIQFSMDNLGFDHDGVVCVFDADLFPVRPFSISEYMKGKDIAAMINPPRGGKIYYVCPIISMFSMNKLPEKKTLSFNVGRIHDVPADSGGCTYYYLKKHPELVVKHINVVYSWQLFLGDAHVFMPVNATVPDDVKTSCYERLGFNEKEIKFFFHQPDTFEFYLENNFLHYRGGSNHTRDPQNYVNAKGKIFTDFIHSILED